MRINRQLLTYGFPKVDPVMTSLNTLLGKAKLPTPSGLASDIKGQISSAMRSTSNEIRNIPAGIASSAINSAKGNVSAAVSGGLADVRSAVNKAIRGDFGGALTTLSQGPQNAMKALGLGSSVAGAGAGQAEYNPLAGALSRADPLMSYQWFIELPAITPIGGGAVDALPWNYVEEATVSMRQFDTRTVWAQGRTHKFASSYSVEPLRLNFYADIESKSFAYLKAWQHAILAPFSIAEFTKGGGFGRPSDYMKPITIYLLAPDNSKVISFQYVEAWPTNLEQLNLDSASSTRLTFPVTFDVGDVFTLIHAVNNNAAGASLVSSLKKSAVNGVMNILF